MDRNLSMFDYLKLVMRQSNITIPERVAKGKGKGKSKQKHRGCFDVMKF
jgi:hypothetical protein